MPKTTASRRQSDTCCRLCHWRNAGGDGRTNP